MWLFRFAFSQFSDISCSKQSVYQLISSVSIVAPFYVTLWWEDHCFFQCCCFVWPSDLLLLWYIYDWSLITNFRFNFTVLKRISWPDNVYLCIRQLLLLFSLFSGCISTHAYYFESLIVCLFIFLFVQVEDNVTVILLSEIVWDKFRPNTGCFEPLLLNFPDYSKGIITLATLHQPASWITLTTLHNDDAQLTDSMWDVTFVPAILF